MIWWLVSFLNKSLFFNFFNLIFLICNINNNFSPKLVIKNPKFLKSQLYIILRVFQETNIFSTKNFGNKKITTMNDPFWVILLSTIITATKVIKSDHLKCNFMVWCLSKELNVMCFLIYFNTRTIFWKLYCLFY